MKITFGLSLLVLLGLMACTMAGPGGTRTYTWDATDYSFSSPETIQGGLVTIKVKNAGKEPHHLQLFRVNDPSQMNTVMEGLKKEDLSVLRFVSMPGGVGALNPGLEGEITANLPEGQYILACFIPSPDGKPHIEKGMIKQIRVTAPSGDAGKEPEPKMTINMKDFSFDQGDTLPAGKNTFKVVNAGPQPHEWNIMRLEQGKTMEDVGKWFAQPAGPPPFQAVGGMNGLTTGQSGYVTLYLPTGNYLAICNIPDPASQKPHAQLGMVKAFTVR